MYYSKPGASADDGLRTFAMIEIICWVDANTQWCACESLHIINWTIFISQEKFLKLDYSGLQPDSDDLERLKKICSTDNVEFVSLSNEE